MKNSKLSHLKLILSSLAENKHLSIAFSGGLDSRFLAFSCRHFGIEPELLHVNGCHIAIQETKEAFEWANQHQFQITDLYIDPLSVDLVTLGDRRRCYGCKKALFTQLSKIASYPLCDGTNHSDLGSYRPGIVALKELNIHSPLAQANLTKSEIRLLAQELGMDHWDQKARPCLLTRYPYGVSPKREELLALSQAEETIGHYLKQILGYIPEFRIRLIHPRKPQLHLLKADEHRLTDKNRQEILSLFSQAAQVIGDLTIVGLDKLSGFFDL